MFDYRIYNIKRIVTKNVPDAIYINATFVRCCYMGLMPLDTNCCNCFNAIKHPLMTIITMR